MEIGKVNLILIALIGVILFTLLLQDHPHPEEADQPLHTQSEPESMPSLPEKVSATQPEPEAESAPPEPEPIPEKHQKNDKAKAAAGSPHPAPAAGEQNHSAGAVTETHTIQPSSSQADTPRHTMIFSIWSVSELRLRSAYTQVMNDSSISPAQQQAAKKDYLDFVNRRTQKCGELDNKFASNINTIEKLTFDEKSVKTLECHTSENITELDRLNAVTMHHH